MFLGIWWKEVYEEEERRRETGYSSLSKNEEEEMVYENDLCGDVVKTRTLSVCHGWL